MNFFYESCGALMGDSVACGEHRGVAVCVVGVNKEACGDSRDWFPWCEEGYLRLAIRTINLVDEFVDDLE